MWKTTGRDGVCFLVPKLQGPAALLGSGCVLQLCCGPGGWDTAVHQLLSAHILVSLGRTPACTGRRHLKHALTGMQVWMCGTTAVGHTANAARPVIQIQLKRLPKVPYTLKCEEQGCSGQEAGKGTEQLWGTCKCSFPGQDLSTGTVQLSRSLSWLQDRRIKSCLSQLEPSIWQRENGFQSQNVSWILTVSLPRVSCSFRKELN